MPPLRNAAAVATSLILAIAIAGVASLATNETDSQPQSAYGTADSVDPPAPPLPLPPLTSTQPVASRSNAAEPARDTPIATADVAVSVTDANPASTNATIRETPSPQVVPVERPTQPSTPAAVATYHPLPTKKTRSSRAVLANRPRGATNSTRTRTTPAVAGAPIAVGSSAVKVSYPPYVDRTPLTDPISLFNKPKSFTQIRGVGYQPHLHERDLPLIRAVGANAIRLWGWHEEVNHFPFLNLLHPLSATAAAPVPNDTSTPLYAILTFNPEFGFGIDKFDIADVLSRPAEFKKVELRWRRMLQKYQNHPAVLMWAIGNEPNKNCGDSELGMWFALAAKLSKIRDAECPLRNMSCWHPITVPFTDAEGVNGWSTLAHLERRFPTAIDVWSMQVYRGSELRSVFGEYRELFQSSVGTRKPIVITEFGVDALDFRINSGTVNESMQSTALVSQWNDIQSESKKLDPAVHSVCGMPVPGADDGFYSESWFGLFAQSGEYGCLAPRKAFYDLARVWTGSALEERCANQSCCVTRDPNALPVLASLLAGIILFGLMYAAWKYASRPATTRDGPLDAAAPRVKPALPAHFRRTNAESPRSAAIRDMSVRLDDCFKACSIANSLSLSANVLGFMAHAELQRTNVHSLLTQQILRCNGDATIAVARVHARTFEHYRAWCSFLSLIPQLRAEVPTLRGDTDTVDCHLRDIADYFVLWSAAENLRRVSSYICQHFHSRFQSVKEGAAPFAAINRVSQQQIETYQLTYDDLDDQSRTDAVNLKGNKLKWLYYSVWDNLLTFRAFPRFGGWAALARNFFFLLRFHVWVGILIVDVCSSIKFHKAGHGFMSVGIFELFSHLLGPDSAHTFVRVCTADALLSIVETALDVMCTHTMRVRHVISLAIAVQWWGVFAGLPFVAPIPSAIASFPLFISYDATTRLTYLYLIARSVQISVGTVWAVARKSDALRGFLPGAMRPPLALPTGAALQQTGSKLTRCSRCRWSGWFVLRSLSFWSIVIAAKAMFDMCVLWPSVAGVTVSSLCVSASDDPFGALHRNALTSGVTCQLFVYFLWFVASLMSVASTYVAYILGLTLFGAVVPHLFAANSRWEKPFLALLMCVWWLALFIALSVGSFLTAFISAIPFLLISIGFSVQFRSQWDTARMCLLKQEPDCHRIPVQSAPQPGPLPSEVPNRSDEKSAPTASNPKFQDVVNHRASDPITCGEPKFTANLMPLASLMSVRAQQIVEDQIEPDRIRELLFRRAAKAGLQPHPTARSRSLVDLFAVSVPEACSQLQSELQSFLLSSEAVTWISELSLRPLLTAIHKHAIGVPVAGVGYALDIGLCIASNGGAAPANGRITEALAGVANRLNERAPLPDDDLVILFALAKLTRKEVVIIAHAPSGGDTTGFAYQYGAGPSRLVLVMHPAAPAVVGKSFAFTPVHYTNSAVAGLQRLLQPLFRVTLQLGDAQFVWDRVMLHFHNSDLLSRREIEADFSPLNGSQFLRRAPGESRVRMRILQFLKSLESFRKKNPEKLPSVLEMRSITVLVPLYNETVSYSVNALTKTTGNGGSAAISLIEFLVEKHKSEWNNFAQRINSSAPTISVQTADTLTADGLTPASRALLDRFMIVNRVRETSRQSKSTDWVETEESICEWASFRGQTLARTVRGLSQIRSALIDIASVEFCGRSGSDESITKLVDSKLQFLVAAQVYGERRKKHHRRHIQQLMKKYPFIEVVFTYDVSSDRIRLIVSRTRFYSQITAESPNPLLFSELSPITEFAVSESVFALHSSAGDRGPVRTTLPSVVAATLVIRNHVTEFTARVDRVIELLTQSGTGGEFTPKLGVATSECEAAAVRDVAWTELLSAAVCKYAEIAQFVESAQAHEPDCGRAATTIRDHARLLQTAIRRLQNWENPAVAATAARSDAPETEPESAPAQTPRSRSAYDPAAGSNRETEEKVPATTSTLMLSSSHRHKKVVKKQIEKTVNRRFSHGELIEERTEEKSNLVEVEEVEDRTNTTTHCASGVSGNGQKERSPPPPYDEKTPPPNSGDPKQLHDSIAQIVCCLSAVHLRIVRAFEMHLLARWVFGAKSGMESGAAGASIDAKHSVSEMSAAGAASLAESDLFATLNELSFPHYSVHCKANRSSGLAEPIGLIGRNSKLSIGSHPQFSDAPTTNPKSENQLHALIFGRGEVIQAIDMNQDVGYEEALKFRWYTTEFQYDRATDYPRFSLVGCPETIYTEHISAVGRYMALQDSSFVTIVQRVLSYTGVRMHYGHPDLFDGFWCRFHIGLSKASVESNLSEDLLFGYDNISRGGDCNFVEYITFGKGREVGLNTTTIFENKLARGAAMTLRTSDVYRLSRYLDPFTRMSLFFGSILHYFFALLTDYTITSYLWVLLLMATSEITSEEIGILGSVYAIPWLFHLGYLFGLPLLFQLMLDRGLMHGAWIWANNLVTGSIYYLFQLRVKAYGIQLAFHGGSGKYAGTGRSIPLHSESLLELYKNYALSHYHHALQLLILLVLYVGVFATEPLSATVLKTYAVLVAVFSWLVAPALFNPTFVMPNPTDGNRPSKAAAAKRKWNELKRMFVWVNTPYDADPTDGGGWERWYWSSRLQSLRLRVVRYAIHTPPPAPAAVLAAPPRVRCSLSVCKSVGPLGEHPIAFCAKELALRLIEWFPWGLLAYSLLLRSFDSGILIIVLAYALIVAIVHVITPKKMHALAIGCLLILFHSYLSIEQSIRPDRGPYGSVSHSLPINRLPDLLSVGVAFLVLNVILTDLLLYGVADVWACYRLHQNPAIDLLKERPAIVRFVCNSGLCFGWRLVMRHLCVYTVGLVHCAVMCLTSAFSSIHTSRFYGVDIDLLGRSQQRRAAAAAALQSASIPVPVSPNGKDRSLSSPSHRSDLQSVLVNP